MKDLRGTQCDLANIPAHQQWGKEIEPYVVSGSNRWEIYRVL